MFRTAICFAFLLASTAEAQPIGTYSVPCQPRAEFSSRLRSLITEPERADAVLSRFTIEIAAGTDGSWTLTVSEPANPASQPRSLSQGTCTELAEAAVLIVAAWAEEVPTPAAPKPPPVAASPASAAAQPAAPVEPPEAAREQPAEDEARMRVGVSLRADGAIYMMPTPSFGAGAAVWFLTADRRTLTTVGVTVWPTHYMEDADILRYQNYERPLWYLFMQQTGYFVEFSPLSLGAFGQLSLGSRRANEGGTSDLIVDVAVGMDVRWKFSDRFAARAQLGAFVVHEAGDTSPGIATLALDLTIN